MLQGRLSIEAEEANSDSARGWICDPRNSMCERSLPNISGPNGCTENTMTPPVPPSLTKKGLGFMFLCCCPQVVPFRTNGIVDGRSAREGIHLPMIDLPELS